MAVLVAGAIAIDSIETPRERRENLLGGSASYAALSASFFSPVQLVGVVGHDFPDEHLRIFREREIDLHGVKVSESEKTFRWSGRYFDDMNQRETTHIALNAAESHVPILTERHASVSAALLANTPPALQLAILEQLPSDVFVIVDSMDLWINRALGELRRVLARADLFVINDGEAQLLAETNNLIVAGERLRSLGPRFVAIKKGEHGALLFGPDLFFTTGAYPLVEVHDPTGAGDCFAGGMVGYLASLPPETISFEALTRSVVYGTVMASFNCESFSADNLRTLSREAIESRYEQIRRFSSF